MMADGLPPIGTIVGPISMHGPGVKFGVVVSGDLPERTQRVCSKDPAVWEPAIKEVVEEIWPRSISQKHQADCERAQLETWGVTGLDILSIEDDSEVARDDAIAHRQVEELDDLDALVMPAIDDPLGFHQYLHATEGA